MFFIWSLTIDDLICWFWTSFCTARTWPLAILKCQYMPAGFLKKGSEWHWVNAEYSPHQHHIQFLFVHKQRGKSSQTTSPSMMAHVGLVPVTLVVSSVVTWNWNIHVFLGSFSAQCDPEMAPRHPECGPWPPPSPALWAEDGLSGAGASPGVCMPVQYVHASVFANSGTASSLPG